MSSALFIEKFVLAYTAYTSRTSDAARKTYLMQPAHLSERFYLI